MSLTVTEREHWKNRIAKRIDKAMEVVYSKEDPGLLTRTKAAAQAEAEESLGIAALKSKREQLAQQIKQLEKETRLVVRHMVATVRGCLVEEVFIADGWRGTPYEVTQAIDQLAAIREEELLAENRLGKQILLLRQEKEELLDTVWLATSGRQIKELWSKVIDRLGQQPTSLQAEAMKLPPEEPSA